MKKKRWFTREQVKWRLIAAKAGQLIPMDIQTRKAYFEEFGIKAPPVRSYYDKHWHQVANENRAGYLEYLKRTEGRA